MCFSSIAFIFLLDLAAITNSSLCSSIFEITFLLKNSLSMYSTSPTGSANHLSPLRFQTFNEKYFEIGMKLNDFSIQLVKYCYESIAKVKTIIQLGNRNVNFK